MKIDQNELDRAYAEYQENGATVLRGVVAQEWIERAGNAIDAILASDNSGQEMSRPGEGRFVGGFFTYMSDPDLHAFIMESGLGELAGRFMKAHEVRFFYDQMLVKEPGTAKRSPWHQDLPYWPTAGEDILSIWVPFDAASPENGVVTYVKGSHRWNAFMPMKPWSDVDDLGADLLEDEVDDAGKPLARPGVDGQTLADIRDHPEKYEFIEYTLEPGDVLLHHPLVIHGAPGNLSQNQRRRAIATRWFGDDARWDDTRPHFLRIFRKTVPDFPYPDLRTGDPIVAPLFPLVWSADQAAEEPVVSVNA